VTERAMNLLSYSGGADSTAMAILLKQQGIEYELVFADTGAEFPETVWMVARTANLLKKNLTVVSNGGFFAWLVQFGWLLPSAHRRWCTRLLKRTPLDKNREVVGAEVVYVGIRADERERASRLAESNPYWQFPLIEAGLGKTDVIALCRKHDLLNPLYQWRTNVSCFCCPFQRKQDWLGMLQHHPTLYRLSEEWEAQSIRTCGFTFSPWPLRELRTADEAQLRLIPDEAPDEPCIICQV